MKKLLISFFFLLIYTTVFSQYREAINTSRPGQAFTPLSVGKNVFQVQSGLNISGSRFEMTDNKLNGKSYSALFRYGVGERIEFRTQMGLSRLTTKPSDQESSGLHSLGIGTKINLLPGGVNRPELGLQADFILPAGSEDFRPDQIATTILLAYSQGIADRISVNGNFGFNWDGNAPHDALALYVLNFGFSLSNKLSSFIEAYGILDEQNQIFFDTGFGYLINNDLMVDLSGGFGKNFGFKQYFIDVGLSWRTKFGVRQ